MANTTNNEKRNSLVLLEQLQKHKPRKSEEDKRRKYRKVKLTTDVVVHEGEVKVNLFIRHVPYRMRDCNDHDKEHSIMRVKEEKMRRTHKRAQKLSKRYKCPIHVPKGPNVMRTFDNTGVPTKFVPTQILYRILTYVGVNTLATSAAVCRQWHEVSSIDMLWMALDKLDEQEISHRLHQDLEENYEDHDDETYVNVFKAIFPKSWKTSVMLTRQFSSIRHDHNMCQPIVIDNGISGFKGGFAGTETPSVTIPNAIAFPRENTVKQARSKRAPAPPLERREDGGIKVLPHRPAFLIGEDIRFTNKLVEYYDIHSPVSLNQMTDFEDLTTIWANVFDALHTDAMDHPVLVSKPMSTPPKVRQQMMEILFETFNVPAAFLEFSPLLSAYAYGELSGLVVDCGASSCQIVPIYQGSIIDYAANRCLALGGSRIDEWVGATASVASQLLKCEIVNPSYFTSHVSRDIKNKLSKVSKTPWNLPDEFMEVISKKTSLPRLNSELNYPDYLPYACGEAYLNPREIFDDEDESIQGLPKIISQVIEHCPMDIRAELYGNIMLCGGGASVPGLKERLLWELKDLMPWATNKIHIQSSHHDSSNIAWQGGSILTLCEEFGGLWELKEDYNEHGLDHVRDSLCEM